MYPLILNHLASTMWLIDENYLRSQEKFLNNLLVNPQTLDNIKSVIVDETGRKQGRDLYIRDEVAIIDISGPIFRNSNIGLCGTTQSTQSIAQDLQLARESKLVKAVILKMNTPGGESTAISELADQIKAFDKPIYTYVEGSCASAGYWLGSASDKIITNKTGLLGSIGAVIEFDLKKKGEDIESIQIVSKQSPYKRFDLKSEEGKEILQTVVDDLATEFIDDIAKNRGVTTEYVLENFGQGLSMIGKKAVKAGMADEIGTLESTIEMIKNVTGTQSVVNNGIYTKNNNQIGGLTSMSNTDKTKTGEVAEGLEAAAPVDEAKIKAEATKTAQESANARVNSIISVFAENGLSGHPKMTELLTNVEAGEMDAYKACTEILREDNTKMKETKGTPLAEQELQKIQADSEELEQIGNTAEPIADTKEGSLDMAAFSEGFNSIGANDCGGK